MFLLCSIMSWMAALCEINDACHTQRFELTSRPCHVTGDLYLTSDSVTAYGPHIPVVSLAF